jgi:hypothetical protein
MRQALLIPRVCELLDKGMTPSQIRKTFKELDTRNIYRVAQAYGWRHPWTHYELEEFTRAIRMGYTVIELLPLSRVDRETFEWRIREKTAKGSPHPNRLPRTAPPAVPGHSAPIYQPQKPYTPPDQDGNSNPQGG